MLKRLVPRLLRVAAAVSALAAAAPAHAYLGPGLGLGAIAASLGVMGSILLGLLSVLWYPVKRFARRLRRLGRKPDDPA